MEAYFATAGWRGLRTFPSGSGSPISLISVTASSSSSLANRLLAYVSIGARVDPDPAHSAGCRVMRGGRTRRRPQGGYYKRGGFRAVSAGVSPASGPILPVIAPLAALAQHAIL